MALQTFTAGQVLTAAQVNALQANDYNQTVSTKTADYVLVAADKGTRVEMNSGSATTITVDTDLFNAGDTLFIQNIGAGVCTITAGTATVSSAGSLALAANAGGTLYFTSAGVSVFFASAAASASGLTLINTTSFSAVASQNFPSVFSATYDNYQIVFNFSGSTSAIALFRISSGASPITTGSYNRKRIYSGTNSTSILQSNGAGQTSIEIGDITSSATTGFVGGSMTVNAPFLATRTGISGSCVAATTGDNFLSLFGGYQSDTTSYDGFALTCSTGTITGTASVYGYQK